MMYFIIGVIMLAIGVFIILFGLINDGIGEAPCYITSYLGWIGMFSGMLIIVIALSDKSNNENKTINENSTEIENVTETQMESAANSTIKVALMQNYPEAEIISNKNDLQHGIFVYNNENYSFEVEDNILFIKQDKKLIKYIYLN